MRNRESYISADIEFGRADIIVDITNMQFSDNSFDYIICNHVMEHIEKEKKAFLEIERCLRPGGTLVLTVPICWEQETFENASIETQKDRMRYYGQKDHVRLYGNDIVKRIEGFGFEVDLYRSDQILRNQEIKKFGYIQKDSVLLCKVKKPK
ncbi:MAG: class I SAM-dependent methyltransferase [Anaeroplasmataceae bacterium]|nr:class I SAM-dependent methyltransferase [Anaeroplasmataceae bacterium]